MAWEIESQHLDLAEMEHVTSFVDRSVVDPKGDFARYLLQIRIGPEITVDDNGVLYDREGKVYDHKAKQKEILEALERRSRGARAFARKHNVPVLKGKPQ